MPSTTRRIPLRGPDRCAHCSRELAAGEPAIWDSGARQAHCLDCGDTWSGVVDAPKAEGEAKLATVLERRTAGHGVVLLHDRASIDHLAIGRAGVFVIDAKAYTGRIQVERRGGLLRSRTAHLMVGGRDKTSLVDGVLAQAEVVRAALTAAVPVLPVLCFVDGDWPPMARLEVRGVPILWPRRAAKLCRGEGPLGAADVEAVADQLARSLPPA